MLLLVAGAGPAQAAGKPKSVASNITLKLNAGIMKRLNPWTFYGRVGSKDARCRRGREVEITFRPEAGGPQQTYGEDTTNRRGRYEVVVNVIPDGRYVAKVLREKKGKVVCEGARSEPIIVDQVWRR